MSDQDSIIDLGGYGAIPSSYGTDTITLSPSTYGVNSITIPTTITTTGTGGLYSTTVPNGGYTIASGAGTGVNWTTGTTSIPNPAVNIDSNGLTMKAGTDIFIDGRSLSKSIDAIEERLGILNPNPELENRWEQLKVLRKQYIELEKDLLEKEKLMKILKEQ
jgi:hypothetical protein